MEGDLPQRRGGKEVGRGILSTSRFANAAISLVALAISVAE